MFWWILEEREEEEEVEVEEEVEGLDGRGVGRRLG